MEEGALTQKLTLHRGDTMIFEPISIDSLPFLIVWLLIAAGVFANYRVAREERDRKAAGHSKVN